MHVESESKSAPLQSKGCGTRQLSGNSAGLDTRATNTMSCDFGVWCPQKRIGNQDAGELYARLCDADTSGVVPHPAVDAFYAELTARHPEIDTVPEEKAAITTTVLGAAN